MRLMYVITTTVLMVLAVALLGSLRFIGLYTHQAFGLAIVAGLLWALVSRAWLAWRGRLYRQFPWEWSKPENQALRRQVLLRGGFWFMLGAAALYVTPRAADLATFHVVLALLALARVAVSAVPGTTANRGPSVVAGLGAVMLLVDLGVAVRPTEAPVLRLEPPFSGEWLVIQAGRSPMQSHHLAAYNQIYAVDLVRLKEGNVFVEGGVGNASVASWEEPLVAPVAGRVVTASDTVEDSVGLNLVAEMEKAAGNVIVIATDSGHFVVLAHLRHGSLLVSEGDTVTVGQPLAKVGNSGNTTMSHLHMQVQTHRNLWDADNRSVPFAFGAEGKTLRRNDRVGRGE